MPTEDEVEKQPVEGQQEVVAPATDETPAQPEATVA